MAIDGHPFLTEELDLQRARQRRMLAYLDRRWLDRAAVGPLEIDHQTPPGMIEAELRNRADALALGGGVMDVLSHDRNGVGLANKLIDATGMVRDPGSWHVKDAAEIPTPQHGPGGGDDATSTKAQAWVFLVTLADLCAGDYLDPRITDD